MESSSQTACALLHSRGEMLSASAAHAIPVKVQGLKDFLFGGSLIDADITYSAQQCEVDLTGRDVLLVMSHIIIQPVILLAVNEERAIVLPYERKCLLQDVMWKPCTDSTHIEFAYQAPCHSISMEDSPILRHGQALKCMSDGMS